jgi:hypothetical protein
MTRPLWKYWLLVLGLGLTIPFLTAAEPSGEPSATTLAANRRLLDRWRADADHFARLQRDLAAFRGLSEEKQGKLRRLDHDLQAKEAATQTRLWRVMHRYADWLERLPENQRNRIDAAATSDERLQIIRDLRDREWLNRLPRAVREQVEKRISQAKPDEKADVLAKARASERQRRQDWQLPPRLMDESRGKPKKPE